MTLPLYDHWINNDSCVVAGDHSVKAHMARLDVDLYDGYVSAERIGALSILLGLCLKDSLAGSRGNLGPGPRNSRRSDYMEPARVDVQRHVVYSSLH